jgi:hypothetical protein
VITEALDTTSRNITKKVAGIVLAVTKKLVVVVSSRSSIFIHTYILVRCPTTKAQNEKVYLHSALKA